MVRSSDINTQLPDCCKGDLSLELAGRGENKFISPLGVFATVSSKYEHLSNQRGLGSALHVLLCCFTNIIEINCEKTWFSVHCTFHKVCAYLLLFLGTAYRWYLGALTIISNHVQCPGDHIMYSTLWHADVF